MGTINLSQSTVEIRENRIGLITGFNGTAKELVQEIFPDLTLLIE